MTEAEWLAAGSPRELLGCLVRRFEGISPRKIHLFACACCRRIWHLLPDERSRRAVELAESYADEGPVTGKELAAGRQAAAAAARSLPGGPGKSGIRQAARAAASCASPNGREAGRAASGEAAKAVGCTAYHDTKAGRSQPIEFWHQAIGDEERRQADLFRDIIPTPFRPAAFGPAWRTPAVLALAEGIYAERAFDRLPVLADALEDAGCKDARVVGHCRGPGPHARGCWVVDLVLGKA